MVNVAGIPAPLDEILMKMLERDSEHRIWMEELLNRAHSELSAFLRSESSRGGAAARFSPLNELTQIQTYLESLPNLPALIPPSRKQSILGKLRSLQGIPGFGESEKKEIEDLIAKVR
jgi:hypothetical protein